MIPHDVVAQYLAALRGIPVVAYKDKSRLFTAHRDVVFPGDIKAEQLILSWEAGEVAEYTVREVLQDATRREDREEVRILKQGGKLFVLAVMAVILNERNGSTYLGRLKREVVTSNRTKERLERYSQLAVIWYVQAVKDLISSGLPLSQIVRSQEMFQKIRDKILTNWRVQSMSKAWVDDALPKL